MGAPTKGLQFFQGPAAFGMYVRRLLDLIEVQMGEALDEHGCRIKANTTGIVWLLHCKGHLSLSEIATELRYSHQLATQRVGWLEQNGFVRSASDSDDRRRRAVALTRAGAREAQCLQRFLRQLEQAFTEMFDEIGTNLLHAVRDAEEALLARPLIKRARQVPSTTQRKRRKSSSGRAAPTP